MVAEKNIKSAMGNKVFENKSKLFRIIE